MLKRIQALPALQNDHFHFPKIIILNLPPPAVSGRITGKMISNCQGSLIHSFLRVQFSAARWGGGGILYLEILFSSHRVIIHASFDTPGSISFQDRYPNPT